MASSLAHFICTETTRVRTRYNVDMCPRGKGRERVLEICERMRRHLGSQKGAVCSSSRDASVSLAAKLGCAYYYVRQVDNPDQLQR